MSDPFKPGDALRCIAKVCAPYGEAANITEGKTYKCLAIDHTDDITFVVIENDFGDRDAYIPDRFERAPQ